ARVFLVALALACSWLLAGEMSRADRGEPKPDPAAVEHCLTILNECPNWSRPPSGATSEWKDALMAAMKQLDEYPTPVLKETVWQYLLTHRGRRSDDPLCARILILNRYIFRVPEKFPKRWVPYHAFWIGMPDGVGTYLAPWSMLPSGQLSLE